MIGLFILAIASLTMTMSSKNALMLSQDARMHDNAAICANEKLIELKAQVDPSPTGTGTAVVDNFNYSLNWAIVDTGEIHRAIITVKWTGLNGEKSLQFSRGI